MKKDTQYQKKIEPSITEARKRRGAEVLINNFILEPKFINLGAGKKYMLKTYGCQGNLADSEKIAGILEMMGFEETTEELKADFVLFNTCAIRENAEERVFGEIGRFEKFRKQNPNMIIGICGCMPQEERTINKLKTTFPHVNIVFGTHNIASLPEFLYDAILSQTKTAYLPYPDGLTERRGSFLASLLHHCIIVTTKGNFTTDAQLSTFNFVNKENAHSKITEILNYPSQTINEQIDKINIYISNQIPSSWDDVAKEYQAIINTLQ